MILSDGIITLRGIEKEDAEILLELINSADVEDSVLGWSFPVTKHQQLQWIEALKNENNVRYSVVVGNKAIGMASLTNIDWKNRVANLNIKLHIKFRGQGFGKRVIAMLKEYAFSELNIHCLTAGILEDNVASIQIFEKNGFELEGRLRHRIYKRGSYKNVLIFSCLKSEDNERNWK